MPTWKSTVTRGIEFSGAQLLDRMDEIVAETKRSSVKPSTICAGYGGCLLDPNPEERETALRNIETLLEAAGRMGAVGLVLAPIFGPPRLPDLAPFRSAVALERELLLVLLDRLADRAEASSTLVLLEPLNRYETHLLKRLRDATEIARELNRPSVRIMADFFHMSIEEPNIAEAIREAGEWIRHVHLADSDRYLPGHGHTDFAAGFGALREVDFSDYMALECRVDGDPEVELPEALAVMRGQLPS